MVWQFRLELGTDDFSQGRNAAMASRLTEDEAALEFWIRQSGRNGDRERFIWWWVQSTDEMTVCLSPRRSWGSCRPRRAFLTHFSNFLHRRDIRPDQHSLLTPFLHVRGRPYSKLVLTFRVDHEEMSQYQSCRRAYPSGNGSLFTSNIFTTVLCIRILHESYLFLTGRAVFGV